MNARPTSPGEGSVTDFREAYGPGDPIPAEAWVVDPLDRTTYYGATDAATILGDWLRERKEFVIRLSTLCDDAIEAARAARLRLRGEA